MKEGAGAGPVWQGEEVADEYSRSMMMPEEVGVALVLFEKGVGSRACLCLSPFRLSSRRDPEARPEKRWGWKGAELSEAWPLILREFCRGAGSSYPLL